MNELSAAITAITTLVAAIGALFISYQNRRAATEARVKAELAAAHAREAKETADAALTGIVKVGEDLFQLGEQVDGRLTALLKAESASSRLAGRAEGIAAEQERSATGGNSIPPSVT